MGGDGPLRGLAGVREERVRRRPGLTTQEHRIFGANPGQGGPLMADGPGAGVLIADDDPVVRRLLEVTLSRLGFRVYLASDGAEAVEVYRRHRAAVGVALLDAQMPGL